MTSKTINLNPVNSEFGPFVPTGTYQKSCQNITITIMCNCIGTDNLELPCVISFKAEETSEIHDILNAEGNVGLQLYKGPYQVVPTAKYGPFIPVGTYQRSSSNISVIIEAQCINDKNNYEPSKLQYNLSDTDSMVDVVNQDGSLVIVKKTDALNQQINAYFKSNLSQLSSALKGILVKEGMDPLPGFNIKMGAYVGFETNNLSFSQVVGLSAIQLTGINVAISSIQENNCTGTVSLSASFEQIYGEMNDVSTGPPMSYLESSDTPGPGQSPDPNYMDNSFVLSAYSINASGGIVFMINQDTFTIKSVSLNAANGAPTVKFSNQNDSQLLEQVFENTTIQTRIRSTTLLGKLITVIDSALQEL